MIYVPFSMKSIIVRKFMKIEFSIKYAGCGNCDDVVEMSARCWDLRPCETYEFPVLSALVFHMVE